MTKHVKLSSMPLEWVTMPYFSLFSHVRSSLFRNQKRGLGLSVLSWKGHPWPNSSRALLCLAESCQTLFCMLLSVPDHCSWYYYYTYYYYYYLSYYYYLAYYCYSSKTTSPITETTTSAATLLATRCAVPCFACHTTHIQFIVSTRFPSFWLGLLRFNQSCCIHWSCEHNVFQQLHSCSMHVSHSSKSAW